MRGATLWSVMLFMACLALIFGGALFAESEIIKGACMGLGLLFLMFAIVEISRGR